ncbi:hypothetical protein HanRHA438_Chr11g0510011 [Helianthus annuus]|nr:hypothetical protein HanRHA438_Chr11g0510011 [Helianthus annuus]
MAVKSSNQRNQVGLQKVPGCAQVLHISVFGDLSEDPQYKSGYFRDRGMVESLSRASHLNIHFHSTQV